MCERPNLKQEDAKSGHESGLDDGTKSSGVSTGVLSSTLAQTLYGAVGPPKLLQLGHATHDKQTALRNFIWFRPSLVNWRRTLTSPRPL